MSYFEELEVLNPLNAANACISSDTPTPHKVAVLLLVQQYIIAKKASEDIGMLYSSESRRHFCMVLLKLIQFPDMTYQDLHNLLTSKKYKIGTIHLEGFERAMADIFTSGVEMLLDFAELRTIDKLLAEQTGVSQFSVVGLYIRRVGMVLERLSFPEIMTLHKNICMYYEKGIRSLAIGPRRISGNRTPDTLNGSEMANGDTPRETEIEISISCMSEGTDTTRSEILTITTSEINMENDLKENAVFLNETNILISPDTTSSQKSRESPIFDDSLSSDEIVPFPMNDSSSVSTPTLYDMDLTLESSNDNEPVMDTDLVHHDRNPHSKWSPQQADIFVTQQCNLLEYNEIRALPPVELQQKLNEIIHDNPLKSQVYFLGYLNQLRLHDYFASMESLRRAFDRSPMHILQNVEQKGFQYFSVNLAILHAAFGHKNEALAALKECVMLAQEAGDKHCLDLANSWYCMLITNRVDTSEKSMPDLQDTTAITSLSLAIQFVVKYGAQRNHVPLDLFELLCKSDELNNKYNIIEHLSESLALRSALWCMYGGNEMSALYAQLLLNLNKTWAFGDIGNSESVSNVLASYALWLHLQGDHSLSALVLEHASDRFHRYPNAANWMISYCHIQIQHATFKCAWDDAMQWCCQLYLLDKTTGNLQRATVLIARRHFNTARRILINLLRCISNDVSYQVHLSKFMQVRTLILLAYTTINNEEITSETVNLLMKASNIALGAFMTYEHALVDVALAQALLKMDMPYKALQAIKNCMEAIYVNGGIYDRAKVDFVFLRCMMAVESNPEEKKKSLENAIPMVETAIDYFKQVNAYSKVLDLLAFMAKTYNELGDIEKRNEHAFRFRQYHDEYPVAQEYLGMAL